MYTEDDLLPISALQHLAYCERQWGLIHLEQVWTESRLTAEGRLLHDRAHEDDTEIHREVRIARGLRLRSLRLGVTGVADVVEFHQSATGVPVSGASGRWHPLIVEYKRGRPKIGREDEVQLCAQALCIEEMLGATIPTSDFFYGKPRRRMHVVMTEELRTETVALALRLHELQDEGVTPPAIYGGKCDQCSLQDRCMPKAMQHPNAREYLARALRRAETD